MTSLFDIERAGAAAHDNGSAFAPTYLRGTPEYDAFERGYFQAYRRANHSSMPALGFASIGPEPKPPAPPLSAEELAEQYRRLRDG